MESNETTKEKILNILKAADEFVSGEEIGKKLNVTRACVSKYVAKLRECGYDIKSVNNKGYRLDKNTEFFNEFEIKYGLNTEFIGKNCKFFEEIASSNDEAKKYDADGTVVVCERQTAGKGRRGRSWESPYGTGLWFSILLKPDITPMLCPQITLISGIALCRAVRELTGLDARLKWPNDVIINGKKAAGILTEMSAEMERIDYIVVGMGINVNTSEFPDELREKAVSLKMCTGKEVSRTKLLQTVLENTELLYKQYIKEKAFKPFVQEYKSLCVNIGKDVIAVQNGIQIRGKVSDINDLGELVIRTCDGSEKNIFAGEVSVRRSDGGYI